MESLYIHVPFCIRKCGYCDFYSRDYDEDLALRYIKAVGQELSLSREHMRPVKTVYIGGGTPSVLSEILLEQMLASVVRRIQLADGYEFTIELNPATISGAKIEIMKMRGVNRVSLGVQSFSDRLLSLLGRAHTAGQSRESIESIRGQFKNFSLDLIYGIPSQETDEWLQTLEDALSFRPPHIAAYELTPEQGTPLCRDIEKGLLSLLGEDTVLEMYRESCSLLRARGYRHYEISNYGIPGFESRHNLNYWRRGEYLGIGPSAHSFLNGKRSSNITDVVRYCEALENGSLPREESIALTAEEEIRETVFLGLRTQHGIDLEQIFGMVRRCGKGTKIDRHALREKLGHFLERGLIDFGDRTMHLTEEGYFLSNTIMVEVMNVLGV